MSFATKLSAVSALLCALLAGCGGGGGGGSTGPIDGRNIDNTQNKWTILVYMNADNDLEPYGLLNLNQMEKVGSDPNVKIVVQVDRASGYDTSNDNWTGCRRYLVTRDSNAQTITSTMLQDMGEVDMGNPGTLREFITWGQTNFPATHTCLVIWNHGSGWRSTMTAQSITRNISFDDTSGTSIRTIDLPYALAGASAPLDLVAFDASLMQMTEVAYEIKDSAAYMVGSEESPPGEGYIYDQWLGALKSRPTMTASELGTSIAQKFVASYTNRFDVTQSVVNLAAVPALAAAVDQLGSAIQPYALTRATELARARAACQEYKFSYYKDLLDYALNIKDALPSPAVSAACSQVQSAMGQAVVYEAHTSGSVSRSHGLSIYVPTPQEYYTGYTTLSFSRDYPNWANWLRSQRQ